MLRVVASIIIALAVVSALMLFVTALAVGMVVFPMQTAIVFITFLTVVLAVIAYAEFGQLL